MMKKAISILLATTLLGTMFVGCGSDKPAETTAAKDDSASTESVAGEAVSDEASSNEETVEITWYYRADAKPDQDMVFEEVNKLMMEKINTTVKFIPIAPSDYEQKMQTKYAAGEAGDINFTASWTNNYAQNVSKGAFLPIDTLLEEHAPDVKEFFTEDIWNAVKVEGEIYGIPNAQIFAKSDNLSIRKDLADQYEFDFSTVEKLEDLEPYLEKASQDGLLFERYSTSGFNTVIYGYGFDDITKFAYVKYADKDLQVVNPYATEEFKEYAKTAQSWTEKGYVASDAMTKKDMEAEVKASKISARNRGVYKPGIDAIETVQWGNGNDVICKPISEMVLSTAGITATINAITATSENPERAMQVLNLVNTDAEIFNMLAYGLEGVHWEKLEDGTVSTFGKDKYIGVNWVMGNTFNGFVLEGQDASVIQDTIDLNNSAVPSEALGFNFDGESVKTQIAQIASVVDEYLPGLYTGGVDVDTVLPEFNEKLDSAGMQELITELQNQLDAWKLTK